MLVFGGVYGFVQSKSFVFFYAYVVVLQERKAYLAYL